MNGRGRWTIISGEIAFRVLQILQIGAEESSGGRYQAILNDAAFKIRAWTGMFRPAAFFTSVSLL